MQKHLITSVISQYTHSQLPMVSIFQNICNSNFLCYNISHLRQYLEGPNHIGLRNLTFLDPVKEWLTRKRSQKSPKSGLSTAFKLSFVAASTLTYNCMYQTGLYSKWGSRHMFTQSHSLRSRYHQVKLAYLCNWLQRSNLLRELSICN